jgi:hypothetical protein
MASSAFKAPSASAASAAGPAWSLSSTAIPTNFSSVHDARCEARNVCDSYTLLATNSGSEPTDGSTITISDGLPAGVTVKSVTGVEWGLEAPLECTPAPVQCTYSHSLAPDRTLQVTIRVMTTGVSGSLATQAAVAGGGAPSVTTSEQTAITAGIAPFGLQDFGFETTGPDGSSETQAAGHPYEATVKFDLMSETRKIPILEGGMPYGPIEEPKDVVVYLPPGFLGDPLATPRCPLKLLAETGPEFDFNPESPTYGQFIPHCPSGSRVGIVNVTLGGQGGVESEEAFKFQQGSLRLFSGVTSLFNVTPEAGHPAELGFGIAGGSVVLYPELVRTSTGYQLRVAVPGVPAQLGHFLGAAVTLFGEPGVRDGEQGATGSFITNPAHCTTEPAMSKLEVDSWEDPARWVSREATAYPDLEGCNLLTFEPAISIQPELTQTDTPSGYEVDLKVPGASSEWPVLQTPELKDATVTLPAGLSVSPSAAGGLQGCEENGPHGIGIPHGTEHADEANEGEEIGPDGLSQLRVGHCPAGSTIGSVEVETPLLPPHSLTGHLYLAEPQCGGVGQHECTEASATNGELYGLYLEAQGRSEGHSDGVIIKLKGTVSVDPQTGQLAATFDENPQLPFSELKIRLNGGPRAPLANPQGCGTFTTTSDLVPWSTPVTPDATSFSSFQTTGCTNPMPFTPSFSAGTAQTLADSFTPFTMTLTRKDGEQDLAGVSLTLPPGVTAMVSKVPLCPEPQASLGTCSEASRIGTVHAAAGAGSEPLWLEGPVYLTGSYKGAPFGLSVVVPAVAGPFNLGNVIERATIDVNPKTAQVTVTSDPFPQIRDGVPLRLKTVNVTVNRPEFTFNPTNCSQLHVTGSVSGDMPEGSPGATVPVSSPFAAAGCKDLPFKPTFTVSTQGKTSKADGASLDVKIASKGGPQAGGGQANIRAVKVDLPKQLPSRLTTLQKACTEAQFNANPADCPAASDVGTATALTPIFSHPLIGPAYLVSHGGEAFPDLEIVLQGEGVKLILDGNTDIKKGITSSTFRTVPDAPISSFELKLSTGPYSILGTNLPASAKYSLCGQKLAMPTAFVGQNGAEIHTSTPISVEGCKPAITVVKRSVKGATATIEVSVPAAGRLVATGKGLSKASDKASRAGTLTVKLTLTRAEAAFLARHPGRRLKAKINLRFTPKKGAKLKTTTTVLIG